MELSAFLSQIPPSAMEKRSIPAGLTSGLEIPAFALKGPSPHDKAFVQQHASKVSGFPAKMLQWYELALLMATPGIGAEIGMVVAQGTLFSRLGVNAIGIGPSLSLDFAVDAIGVGGGVAIGFAPFSVGLFGGIGLADVGKWITDGKFRGLFVGAGASADMCMYLMRDIGDFGGTGYAIGGDVFFEVGAGAALLFDSNWTWIGLEGYGGVGFGGGLGILKTIGGIDHT